MENKIEIKRDLAHVDYESGRYQTMKEHSENVANYVAETCSLSELKILVSLIGVFHDVGKLGRENQEDFERILQYGDDTHKHGLDHSTAGGRLIRELMKEKSVSEFISTVIYFHHGMGDCINLDNGQSLQQQRDEKQIDYDWIKKEFFQIYDKEMLEEYCKKAIQTYKEMEGKINIFHKESEISKRKCGNRYFFMGMYLRTVFIVQMSEKAEKLSHLQEIRNAQAALQKVLEDYKNNSLKFRDTLDSEEAIKAYYLNYYSQLRTNETKFLIDKQTTTIIELLGENKVGQLQYIRRNGEKVKTKLPQAFLTAGQAFEVISNDYKVSVVVPYNDEARELLDKLSQDYLEIEEQKKILKKLQRYTVGISEKRKEKLGNAIYEICNGEILVLCDGYYDKEVGVVNEPNMELQML